MLKLTDYSEKTFIITGDTKPIKDKLKQLGGRWNPYLTGWIFHKIHLAIVKDTLKDSLQQNEIPIKHNNLSMVFYLLVYRILALL